MAVADAALFQRLEHTEPQTYDHRDDSTTHHSTRYARHMPDVHLGCYVRIKVVHGSPVKTLAHACLCGHVVVCEHVQHLPLAIQRHTRLPAILQHVEQRRTIVRRRLQRTKRTIGGRDDDGREEQGYS